MKCCLFENNIKKINFKINLKILNQDDGLTSLVDSS